MLLKTISAGAALCAAAALGAVTGVPAHASAPAAAGNPVFYVGQGPIYPAGHEPTTRKDGWCLTAIETRLVRGTTVWLAESRQCPLGGSPHDAYQFWTVTMTQENGVFTSVLLRNAGTGTCLIANVVDSPSYAATLDSCDSLAFLRVAPAGGRWRIAKLKYKSSYLQFLTIATPFSVGGVGAVAHWDDAGRAERAISYWNLPRMHQAQDS
jgi:hypothetical protein